jgi:hypothetical protein
LRQVARLAQVLSPANSESCPAFTRAAIEVILGIIVLGRAASVGGTRRCSAHGN